MFTDMYVKEMCVSSLEHVWKVNVKRVVKNEEGFTLIELMVVLAIIGVLAGLSAPLLAQQQKQVVQAEIRSEVRATVAEIKTMLIRYPVAANTSSNSGKFSDTLASHKIESDVIALQVGGKFLYDSSGKITTVDPMTYASWGGYHVLGYDQTDTSDDPYYYAYDSTTKKFLEIF